MHIMMQKTMAQTEMMVFGLPRLVSDVGPEEGAEEAESLEGGDVTKLMDF